MLPYVTLSVSARTITTSPILVRAVSEIILSSRGRPSREVTDPIFSGSTFVIAFIVLPEARSYLVGRPRLRCPVGRGNEDGVIARNGPDNLRKRSTVDAHRNGRGEARLALDNKKVVANRDHALKR